MGTKVEEGARRPFRRTLALTLAVIGLAGCALMNPDAGGQSAIGAGESWAGNYLAGRLAQEEEDFAAAALYYRAALERDPANPELMRRAMVLSAGQGDMDEAKALAQRIEQLNPGDPFAELVLALDQIRRDDLAGAERRLDDVEISGVNTLLVPLVEAWVRFGRGRSGEAVTVLDGLADTASFATFRYYHTALVHDAAGDVEGAEAAYDLALQSPGPTPLRLVEAYGSFLERQGRGEDARRLYQDLLLRAPQSTSLSAAFDRYLRGEEAKLLVENAPQGTAEALYGVGGVLFREGAYSAALFYVRLAIHLRPDLDEAQLLIGDILDAASQPAQAIEAYRGIAETSPLYEPAAIKIAQNLARLERFDEAARLLRRLAERSQSEEPLVTLAELLRGQERWEDAADAYSQALERISTVEPRHWTLFYSRGICYERAGDWPPAEADFLRALELAPEQPLVLNYLGYSWVEQGLHLDRARGMLERAVELRPRDGFIVDSLGWVLYRLGDFKGAVEKLERAVELQADDPTINDHLGDAYWRVGRRAEARFQWQRALSFEPATEEEALRIRRKLETGLGPATPEI